LKTFDTQLYISFSDNADITWKLLVHSCTFHCLITLTLI